MFDFGTEDYWMRREEEAYYNGELDVVRGAELDYHCYGCPMYHECKLDKCTPEDDSLPGDDCPF